MNSLLGQGSILIGLACAMAGLLVGLQAGRTRSAVGLKQTRGLAYGFAWSMVVANAVMINALLQRDFTVRYVDQVGSHDVPNYIAFVSLWSALEGSILFWGAILGLYVLAFLVATRNRHEDMQGYTLATILAVGAFFAFLIAGPADPFGAVTPIAGKPHVGPNPLLQNHVLMIIHPPMLYLGYVGMTIPFAMGVAALLRGRLGAGWMRPLRRWMLLPWGFLTAGIVLGGWWAYEVLGWGGYWAWDPVENASFLPWLSATGFLHAAQLQERRGVLKGWTMVLLMSTFALTILGTFMTRSGVFNSVHSFTQSPIGPIFLVFLGVVLVVSVVLIGLRVHLLEPEGEFHSVVSRDAMFVVNNLLFVAFTMTVLIGTVFPLLAEAIRGVKISVGEPYFNLLSVPIGVAIVFLMGVGPALPWGRATPAEARRALAMPSAVGVGLTLVAAGFGARNFWVLATFWTSGFAAAVSFRDMAAPVQAIHRRRGGSLGSSMAEAYRRGRRRYGGQIVHLGVALMAVSIAVSWTYQTSTEIVLDKGESAVVGDYTLTFEGREQWQEPHRQVVAANVKVVRPGAGEAILQPRMNRYTGQMSPIGTPAVKTRIGEDLYLSAMQIDDAGEFVGLRVFINPMIYWVWVAAGVMVFGCLIAMWPPKERHTAVASAAGDPAVEAA